MKQLKIENDNNKLQCEGFLQIHFAPPVNGFDPSGQFKIAIKEESFNTTYMINVNGEDIFVKLDCFTRIKFWQISSIYTIPGYGVDSFDFKKMFKEKYPNTNDETQMAVYCYLRVK